MNQNYKIAIDGPAGAGKSTIAKQLAFKFNYLYIDSGAMYRCVTLFMLQNKLFNLNESKLTRLLKKIKINFAYKNKELSQRVFLNDVDVSKKIRSSEINGRVSEVAAIKSVREEMVKRQKNFGEIKSVVMDGRDIGTVVFPNANLKIYLTASAEVRAQRRLKDFKAIGEKKDIQILIHEIQSRDNYDSSRNISPLTKAQGALVIDCSNLSITQVLEKIYFFLPYRLN